MTWSLRDCYQADTRRSRGRFVAQEWREKTYERTLAQSRRLGEATEQKRQAQLAAWETQERAYAEEVAQQREHDRQVWREQEAMV